MNHQSLNTVIFVLVCFNFGISQNLEKTRDNSDQLKYELVANLEKENLDKEYFIEVPSNAKSIFCSVKGKITYGNLKIKVKDSNNRSEGVFHLTTNKKDGRHSTAKGNYENQLNHPIRGKWSIKVESDEAQGNFDLVVVIEK